MGQTDGRNRHKLLGLQILTINLTINR